MHSSMYKLLVMYILSSTALMAAEHTALISDLKMQLITAHTIIKGFVYSKIREFNKPFKPRNVNRSVRRLIMHILDSNSAQNAILAEEYGTQTVHLMYQALQEAEPLDDDTFNEWYDLYPDELQHFSTTSLLHLHDYIAHSPLWLAPKKLLQVCQDVFELVH